ncbi:cation:proton antiporter [Tautonia plasticadhaerens]|uniref:K(+)/H(+) antiporter NhaP n=1 Tax=Tautonia plasticadhaerens TaxID=2527974 RepID=A0A518HD93_9BACT|nr:cation:proton antiporter [Tautonia plasticadhaerens]QDV38646.1 K(+)/H(+) antiporter NhaP [Tautonia plasticadhaerens]
MQTEVMVQLAAIVVLGIGAQWVAWRLNLPAILLLLIAGLAAGPGAEWLGPGRLVDPNALLGDTLPPLISLSVAVILFEGGLSLRLADLRTSMAVIRNLVTVGAGVTWAIGAVAAKLLVGVPWPLAILLGAILVVTGPTVIGPLLRHVRPSGGVGPILMWEGIVIDPIGAVLAVLVFEFIGSADGAGAGLSVVIAGALRTLVVGLAVGVSGAAAMIWVLGRYWVPDYLHNPVALMVVVASFTLSGVLQEESGLLTVTVMGLVLANQRSVSIRHIAEFKESLTVLLVSVLFVVLAARLSPGQIAAAGPGSVLFTLALILLARPLAVLASTAGQGLGWPERIFLMGMAPRGIVAAAVASVFAIRLRGEGIAGADRLVPAAFTAIIGTVIVYGLASGPLARRLGLTGGRLGYLIAGANPIGLAIARALRAEEIPVMLVDTRTDRLDSADHDGIPTLHASILSPFVRERIDAGRIGRLLSLTPNEEVNSLAALHFTSLFGRESVFQLTPEPHGAARNPANGDAGPEPDVASSLSAQIDAVDAHEAGRSVALELHGRVLFGPGMTYKHLDSMLYSGSTVERLPLEDGDDPAGAFRARFGPEAVPLLISKEGGDVVPVTASPVADARIPRAVIGLAPPPRRDG